MGFLDGLLKKAGSSRRPRGEGCNPDWRCRRIRRRCRSLAHQKKAKGDAAGAARLALEAAKAHKAAGFNQKAIAVLKSAAQWDPTRAEVFELLAQTYLEHEAQGGRPRRLPHLEEDLPRREEERRRQAHRGEECRARPRPLIWNGFIIAAKSSRMTSPIRPAQRTAGIRYAVRDILKVADEAEKAGKELLPLNIGDPLRYDFATPPHMVEAVQKALKDGRHGYAPSPGTPEALAAVRRWAERKGLPGIRDIYVSNGASECIELALTALVDRGEEVLLPEPRLPALHGGAGEAEGETGHFPRRGERLAARPGGDRGPSPTTRAIVLINPNNPTGGLRP